MTKPKMLKRTSWDLFQQEGMLWWINRMLHVFGWAIVVEVDDNDKVTDAYPARCKFRGFCTDVEERGFKRISRAMKKNCERLYKETME
jgi:hypothetical protein